MWAVNWDLNKILAIQFKNPFSISGIVASQTRRPFKSLFYVVEIYSSTEEGSPEVSLCLSRTIPSNSPEPTLAVWSNTIEINKLNSIALDIFETDPSTTFLTIQGFSVWGWGRGSDLFYDRRGWAGLSGLWGPIDKRLRRRGHNLSDTALRSRLQAMMQWPGTNIM